MKFYRINEIEGCSYAITADQVKTFMKAVEPVMRAAYTVDEVDVSTNKESLLALLNTEGIRCDGTSIFSHPLRTFGVTNRGALFEMSKSQAPRAKGSNYEG